MLLAHGEEPVVAIPDAADPAQAQAPATANAPQIRDAAATAHARPGAESDDGELPLLVGVLLGETEELLIERGSILLSMHHSSTIIFTLYEKRIRVDPLFRFFVSALTTAALDGLA